MKNMLNEFHDANVANASALHLALACMLLLGVTPRDDEESQARCRAALTKEYAPWLFPAVSQCHVVNEMAAKSDVAAALAKGGHSRMSALGLLFTLLFHEVGGFRGLQKSAASATAKMEKLNSVISPLIDKLNGLTDVLKATVGEKDADLVVDLHISPNASEHTVAAAKEAHRIIEESVKAGESDEVIVQRIRKAYASIDPNAEIGVITIEIDGTVSGDLDKATPEILEMVERERAIRQSSH